MLITCSDVLQPGIQRLTKRTAFVLGLTFCLSQISVSQSFAGQTSTGKKLFVTAKAVDSIFCGPRDKPCRSISQAIRNADTGDHIFVAPGIYGDINNDGDFDDPGDEKAELGYGCRCIILINKTLTLTSIVGAKTTIVDANNAVANVIAITADNVEFGKERHGFTLTGARSKVNKLGAGLKATANDLLIYGNIAANNSGVGFDISGIGHRFQENYSSKNAHGFFFAYTKKGYVIKDNIASNNGVKTGFGHGFLIYGNGYTVERNMANENRGNGFIISSDSISTNKEIFTFTGNTSIRNEGQGVYKFAGANIRSMVNIIFGNLEKENTYQ